MSPTQSEWRRFSAVGGLHQFGPDSKYDVAMSSPAPASDDADRCSSCGHLPEQECGCTCCCHEGDGAWQCPDGHMFRYDPPPSYPPWCAIPGCLVGGEMKWIIKNDVTARDWLPE